MYITLLPNVNRFEVLLNSKSDILLNELSKFLYYAYKDFVSDYKSV